MLLCQDHQQIISCLLYTSKITVSTEKKSDGLSGLQALIVSTATRVGMGNLVGVVAAVSAGGAGAVFWMWVTAIVGSATAFIESTLAQIYKEKDPLYGGYRGGPAYFLHSLAERVRGKKLKRSVLAVLFAISGLICWCGISQVIGNSVSTSLKNAFHIPTLWTAVALTIVLSLIHISQMAEREQRIDNEDRHQENDGTGKDGDGHPFKSI